MASDEDGVRAEARADTLITRFTQTMDIDLRTVLILGALVAVAAVLGGEAHGQAAESRILVENFEGYEAGMQPYHWKRPHKKSRSLLDLSPELERDDDYFEVVAEDGGKRARAYTRDESVQIVRLNGDGYQWDLDTHPVLAWQWKAKRLPEGAREDKDRYNDTGAAVYVTFDSKDWLGRPRSIKYTYSSTLPIGTTARYGPLRVVVVATGADGMGRWIRNQRNVAEDFKRLFGKERPPKPGYIMLWSDSDNTHAVADVYFDDIELLPARN